MYIMENQLYWVVPYITDKDIGAQSAPFAIFATTSLSFTVCVDKTDGTRDLVEGESHPVDTRLCAVRADRCQGGVVRFEA